MRSRFEVPNRSGGHPDERAECGAGQARLAAQSTQAVRIECVSGHRAVAFVEREGRPAQSRGEEPCSWFWFMPGRVRAGAAWAAPSRRIRIKCDDSVTIDRRSVKAES